MVESVLVFIQGDELSDSRLREIATMLAKSPDTIYFLSAPTKKLFQYYLKYLSAITIYNHNDYLSPKCLKENITGIISLWLFSETSNDYFEVNRVSEMSNVRRLDSCEPYQGVPV